MVAQAAGRGYVHRAYSGAARPSTATHGGDARAWPALGAITDSASSMEIRPVASRNRAKQRILPAMSATVERAYRSVHPIRKASMSVSAIVAHALSDAPRCSESFPMCTNFLCTVVSGLPR